MSTDIQHDRDLCQHDARVDAWERDWDLLRRNLIAECKSLGFGYVGYEIILEKAAGDIIDLIQTKPEPNLLDSIMSEGIEGGWIKQLEEL